MSQFTWEPVSVDEPQAEVQVEVQDEPEEALQDAEPQSAEAAGQAGNLALSPDDFSALEERILRAVDLVKRGRVAQAAAEERAAQAEVRLGEQAPLVENLEKEVSALRAEREQMRTRVERLLEQLDALEL
jgi:uncharacterized coiled-coil protein SlyX